MSTSTPVYTPVWSGQGHEFDKRITIDQALAEAGLDWTVEKVPLPKPNAPGFIQGRWGVERSTDKEILGVVGNTWEPVQNRDGFQIVQDVIEQAGGNVCRIQSTGDFDDGRVVWVLVDVDEGLQVAGERYASHILFINGHNGRRSVTACMMTTRFVCQNMMGWGMGDDRIVRVRHTTKAAERIKEAHHILRMRNKAKEELAQQGEWLVEQSMDDGDFAEFLDSLMPLPEEEGPAHTMITNRRASIYGIYSGATNLEPIRGTRWGALQAVCEYADHGREFKTAETQLKAHWALTNTSGLKQQAFDYLADDMPVLTSPN